MKITFTKPDDLKPGDKVVWHAVPEKQATVKHVIVRNDRPTGRTLEFEHGGTVFCDANDEFHRIDEEEVK